MQKFFNEILSEKSTKEILKNLQEEKIDLKLLIKPLKLIENLYNPVYKKFKNEEKELFKLIKSLDWNTKLRTKIKEIIVNKDNLTNIYQEVQGIFEFLIPLIEKQAQFIKETLELLPFHLDSLFIVILYVSLGLDVPEDLKFLLETLDYKKCGYIPLNLSEPIIEEETKLITQEIKKEQQKESLKEANRINHFNRGLTNTNALFKTVKVKLSSKNRVKKVPKNKLIEKRKEMEESNEENQKKKVKKDEILAPDSPERIIETHDDDHLIILSSSPDMNGKIK